MIAVSAGGPLSFPAHLPDLEEQIRTYRADLVVIDPVMAFLPPEVAANLDQCVRRALNPLAALAGGPRPATDLLGAAADAGIPEKTLRRAKSKSGVRSHCAAAKGANVWYWYDGGAPWPAGAPFKKPFELEPLS